MVHFAAQDGIFALNIGTDIAVFLVPADADVIERHLVHVDLLKAIEADLGAAGIEMTVLVDQPLQELDGVLPDAFQVLFCGIEGLLLQFDLLAVFIDFKGGDPADGDFHQTGDFGIRNDPGSHLVEPFFRIFINGDDVGTVLNIVVKRLHDGLPLGAEFFQPLPDLGKHGFAGFTFFDPLVDPFFNEDLRESAGKDLFQTFSRLDLQFPGQVLDQFFRVALQDLRDRHAAGTVVHNDHGGTGNGELAIGISIQGVQRFCGIVAADGIQLNIDLCRRKVLGRGDLDLVLLDGIVNGNQQPFGIDGGGDLPDHDVASFDLQFCPDSQFSLAVLVLGNVHDPALKEVGIQGERFALEIGDLRLQHFHKVVGHDLGGGPDGDPVRPHDEEGGDLGGEHDRFHISAVIRINDLRDVPVEQDILRQRGQAAFDITGSSRSHTGDDAAVVALFVNKHFLVRQIDESAIDGSIAVGVKLHGIADHTCDLVEGAVIRQVHCPEDTALSRLQTVVDIRDRPVLDDV